MIVTLTDLTEKVAARLKLEKPQANLFIREFYDILSQELMAGNDVVVRNQFTLKIVTRKAREGNDFTSGERIKLPERRVVKFVPSAQMFKVLTGS